MVIKVFYSPGLLEKVVVFHYIIRSDYDYTEKPEMIVMTEYLECIFVEVVCVANKTKYVNRCSL